MTSSTEELPVIELDGVDDSAAAARMSLKRFKSRPGWPIEIANWIALR
jgi:hypothetical protein